MNAKDRAAIQSDVEMDEGLEKQERPLSARDQMLEQLGERRELELTGGISDEDETPAAKAAPAAARVQGVAEGDDPMVKGVIDGEEQDLPLAAVVKGYQKDSAGSKKLEEAARLKKELDERQVALDAQEQQFKRQMEESAIVDQDEDEDEDDDLVATLDSFVENGDSAQTAAMIRKTIERALKKATPTLGKEDLSAAVEAKLEEDRQKRAREDAAEEHARANADFLQNYGDIVKDPRALAAANTTFYAKLDEGKSITEAMAEAGAETKEWLGGNRASTARETKNQRKAAMDSLPQVGARVKPKVDADNEPESPSDIIKEMRRQRNLPV